MRAARRISAAGAAGFGLVALLFTPALAEDLAVDVELVLAVDISMSMDLDEQRLQREGYIQAFLDPTVVEAVEHGYHGRIAVAYMEWAGEITQQVTVDWMMIDGADTAAELAGVLGEVPIIRARRTSVSAAIDFAAGMFADNGFGGLRQVIDISGDGVNNQGRPVTDARDEAVAQGIIINGLPFLPHADRPLSLFDLPELDLYYEDCVIGGPGAFSLPVYRKEDFAEAIRTKLIMEIAGRPLPLMRVAAHAPRVSCTSGEEQWQRMFSR